MAADGTAFEPGAVLGQITEATGQLLRTAARLGEGDVRAPSLLPGWSRAHVLTHLARNADGGRRLLTWARTGTRTPEYPSLTARAEEIEAGAGRGAAELLADLRDSAAAFEAEYRRMPPEGWDRVVRWTRGQEHPASRAADARLTEVVVHHADLDAGYTPDDWPAAFTDAMLGRVAASFSARDDAPPMRLHATDAVAVYSVGAPRLAGPTVRGTRSALLAWLMGRSPGDGLTVHGGGALPAPPFLY
ncbi:maleylpyruvate isomerase [Actinacidiphila rubida]|uniref:Maleylpyruvate isomerase n=1 Tax=Actinacidiphila rubida TaxID=310780 RepID=A0A1H8FYY8_9ACTN|nr:maleylpyruvate isomerase family mycothiol-dependent enzyme [Actinacidiphila rubida]SEN36730.1 maleylpyruvate isomerase [Actinacidiphila rubida]